MLILADNNREGGNMEFIEVLGLVAIGGFFTLWTIHFKLLMNMDKARNLSDGMARDLFEAHMQEKKELVVSTSDQNMLLIERINAIHDEDRARLDRIETLHNGDREVLKELHEKIQVQNDIINSLVNTLGHETFKKILYDLNEKKEKGAKGASNQQKAQ